MAEDAMKRCAQCGAGHLKVFTWIDSQQRRYDFCNMECKRKFFEETYPAMLEKEKENAESGILPEVRVLVAHKTKEGISILRRDS